MFEHRQVVCQVESRRFFCRLPHTILEVPPVCLYENARLLCGVTRSRNGRSSGSKICEETKREGFGFYF